MGKTSDDLRGSAAAFAESLEGARSTLEEQRDSMSLAADRAADELDLREAEVKALRRLNRELRSVRMDDIRLALGKHIVEDESIVDAVHRLSADLVDARHEIEKQREKANIYGRCAHAVNEATGFERLLHQKDGEPLWEAMARHTRERVGQRSGPAYVRWVSLLDEERAVLGAAWALSTIPAIPGGENREKMERLVLDRCMDLPQDRLPEMRE